MRAGVASLLLALLLAGCGSTLDFVPRYFAPTNRGTEVMIPLEPGISDTASLQARICRPDIPGRLHVVVINHGAPSDPSRRLQMQPTGCDTEAAQWFMDRGYVVVFALRRGFGGSTGPAVEDTGACVSPNYFRSGLFSAMDIDAILRFATTQPYTRPDGAIVIGQSTGGWGTIAYDSVENPLAAVFISFAGGRGGHAYPDPPTNCRPDLLVDAAKRYGQSSVAPMLWIYAENDTFFPPSLANAMHRAYVTAGGRAELVFVPPYGTEGHGLFYAPGASAVWGPIVERYMAQQLRP
jgi:pimeloyl-ACP methyl ester carboxylesterase